MCERERERERERGCDCDCVGGRGKYYAKGRVNIDLFVVALYTTFFPTNSLDGCVHYLLRSHPFLGLFLFPGSVALIWGMNNCYQLSVIHNIVTQTLNLNSMHHTIRKK